MPGDKKLWGTLHDHDLLRPIGDAVKVYGNVNNIKVLGQKKYSISFQLSLMLMQSSVLLNVDSTTTLFSLRTRQLKAEPLNNMLRNVFEVPAALNEMHFFIPQLCLSLQ